VLAWSCLLLIRGILAALRQKFHLTTCPNSPGHLLLRCLAHKAGQHQRCNDACDLPAWVLMGPPRTRVGNSLEPSQNHHGALVPDSLVQRPLRASSSALIAANFSSGVRLRTPPGWVVGDAGRARDEGGGTVARVGCQLAGRWDGWRLR